MCYNKIILKNLEDKMSEYIGSKCFICDTTFTKDDDIVVVLIVVHRIIESVTKRRKMYK